MKTEIHTHLHEPVYLERLYRSNRSAFKQAFNELFPTPNGNTAAGYWHARLNYTDNTVNRGTGKDVLFIVVAAALAALYAQLPALFAIDGDFFYPRNIGFIGLVPLAMYFAWKHALPKGKVTALFALILICAIYINLLPNIPQSDTVVLSCLHIVPVLWALVGFAFGGGMYRNEEQRIRFLTYNGDLLVMMGLIAIAGGILSAVTINLFAAIGLQIEDVYGRYIITSCAPAVPLVATYLIRQNPQLVGKISPVIARIFCPLVLVMLVVYLIAMVYSGKDPYTDRDFLLLFNIMLIGVLAIIFFAIAGVSSAAKNRTGIWVITLLAVVTVIVNGVALSAILFRIAEWGITPNRAAVLGANVLILVNLVWVSVRLAGVLRQGTPITGVQQVIARYLPVYVGWALVVTFVFPLVFGW